MVKNAFDHMINFYSCAASFLDEKPHGGNLSLVVELRYNFDELNKGSLILIISLIK